jgi:hypothetical protein
VYRDSFPERDDSDHAKLSQERAGAAPTDYRECDTPRKGLATQPSRAVSRSVSRRTCACWATSPIVHLSIGTPPWEGEYTLDLTTGQG